MKTAKMEFEGTWHIFEMEMWDADYFNMEVQAFITITGNGTGDFQFGLVSGAIHGEIDNESKRFEFTWEGNDECDQASGGGWMKLRDPENIEGKIKMHHGDSSKFRARLYHSESRPAVLPPKKGKAVGKGKEQYQLKIILKGASPQIWRRILVNEDIKLSKLHDIIQIVMGWTNSHLHHFIHGKKFFSDPEFDDTGELDYIDEKTVTLKSLMNKPKQKITYEYDFGDGWVHEIVLEKILSDETLKTPICLEGKMACPPEDCGGIGGFNELLETIKDPDDSEYESTMEWLGGKYDAEQFNIERVNRILKNVKKA